MHYLRMTYPDTLQHLDNTTQLFDETMTFFETGGFRCGTCFTYQAYDFNQQKKFKIAIKPLILMEASALSYLNLGVDGTLNYAKNLIDNCSKVKGEFTLLWHNCGLNDQNKKLYGDITNYLSEKAKQYLNLWVYDYFRKTETRK